VSPRRRKRLIVTAVLLALAVGIWLVSRDTLFGLVQLGLCVLVIAFYWTESSGR